MREDFNDIEIERYLNQNDPYIKRTLAILKVAENTDSEKIDFITKELNKRKEILHCLDERIQVFAQTVVDEKGFKIYELPPELTKEFVCMTYEKLGWMDVPTNNEIEANNNEFIYRRALINTFRKEWLRFQISRFKASNKKPDTNTQEDEEKNSETHKKTVEEHFRFMLKNDPRKHKPILSSDDHDKLVNWVTAYFENELEVPEITHPIKNCNTAHGNVVHTFRILFKEIHPFSTYPESLWELIRSCFHRLKKHEDKALSKWKASEDYDKLPHKH